MEQNIRLSVFWLFLCWETLANDCSSACTILNMVCLIIWTKTYVNIELKQICMCYIPPKAKYTCMREKWQYSNLFLKLLYLHVVHFSAVIDEQSLGSNDLYQDKWGRHLLYNVVGIFDFILHVFTNWLRRGNIWFIKCSQFLSLVWSIISRVKVK